MRGDILQHKRGDLVQVAWELGGDILIHGGFRGMSYHRPVRSDIQIATVGVPVDVGPGGNVEHEQAYGNHSTAGKHATEVWEKTAADFRTGRAIMIPVRLKLMVRGSRTNPVGVVKDEGTKRVVYILK